MWSQADAVPGIKSVHIMKAVPNQDLVLSSNGQTATPVTSLSSAASDEERFKENDWVLVQYDQKTYPGIVTAVLGSDIEVSVMEMSGTTGSFWKWPLKEDKILYTTDNVLCHIEPPEVVGSRGQYAFKRFDDFGKK